MFSGYLYFGFLVVVVVFYLDVCVVGGCWLVCMEDFDLFCEVLGVQQVILEILECYGFEWDGVVEWQSECFLVYVVVVE